MAKMTKLALQAAVLEQVSQAEGFDSDELSELREKALDYYFNRDSAAPSIPGRSKQQSTDVADMVEALLAQILPAFEIDNPVEFEPAGPDDVDQAATESDSVNYMIMEANQGYIELQEAIKDALLLRNGLMKVYVDERVETNTESWEAVTDLQLMQAEQGGQGVVAEIVKHEKREDGLHDMTVRTTTTTRKLKVEAVDVTCFGWFRNHTSLDLQDCPFCFERSYPTRSELITMGYSATEINNLSHTTLDDQGDALARNDDQRDSYSEAPDASQERIEFHECYMRVDADGDGVAELMKICLGDGQVLEAEPIDYVPYASGTPFIRSHRFNGISIFDKIRGVQDSKTHVLRQWLDNQNHANNSRVIVYGSMTNLSDVTNSRPGGVVRSKGMQGDIQPFPFTDVGPSCENMLAYLDKQRSERGGASLDLQAAELQIAGDTAHGVERQMSSREQLAAMITRTLAETLLRNTARLTHLVMRKYDFGTMMIRARGKFSAVEPSQWPERERINITAGLSLGERMRKKASLEQVLAKNEADKAAGVYVSPKAEYSARLDWARSAGMDNPERYFTDPESEEAQQAAQAQAQSQQAQQQYQDQLLQMQLQIENQKHEIEQAKVHQAEHDTQMEYQFKYWAESLRAEIEEAKIVGSAAIKLGEQAIGHERASGEDDRGSGSGDQSGRDQSATSH